MVTVALPAQRAAPQPVALPGEGGDDDLRLAAGLLELGEAPAPAQQAILVLDHDVRDLTIGGERVGIEDENAAWSEVVVHAVERVGNLAGGEEVVYRVVYARDEVELAEGGQPAHVGDVDVDARAGLLPRQRHHLGRDVARGDVEPPLEEREEALAGAAADVQQAVAGQAVLARETFDG